MIDPYCEWLIERALLSPNDSSVYGQPGLADVEAAVQLMLRSTRKTEGARCWVVTDDPMVLSACGASVAVVACFRPHEVSRASGTNDGIGPIAADSALVGGLQMLLRALGFPTSRSDPHSGTMEAIVRSSVGAPDHAELIALLVVGTTTVSATDDQLSRTDRLAIGDWESARTVRAAAFVMPTPPDVERFKRFGVCGSCRPLGRCRVGVIMRVTSEGSIAGSVMFSEDYAGAPGMAHGGFVATAFDDVLSRAAAFGVYAAMTGTMTVRYRRPIPTGVRLSIAGRTDKVEGRKRFVSAEIISSGDHTVLAEGSGVWVEVPAVPSADV